VLKGAAVGALIGGGVAATTITISSTRGGEVLQGVRTISRHGTGLEVAGVILGTALLGGLIGAFIGATPKAHKEPKPTPERMEPISMEDLGLATATGTTSAPTSLSQAVATANEATQQPLPPWVTQATLPPWQQGPPAAIPSYYPQPAPDYSGH